MPAKGAHGEPWEAEDSDVGECAPLALYIMGTIEGFEVPIATFGRREDRDCTIERVNELDGVTVKEPGAVRDALELLSDWQFCVPQHCRCKVASRNQRNGFRHDLCLSCRTKKALSRIQVAPSEATQDERGE